MSVDSRDYDIIIFGVSGYTGQYVLEELAISSKHTDVKFAVAGRSIQKIKKSLRIVQEYLRDSYDINILDIPIVKADINDQNSILNMCRATKVIINCVGPYKLFGESMVSACIEARTHHVDLSVELSYLESTQAKYFAAAREKGIYIIQTCGFASIPADYGISVMKKNFPGDLNSVECYVEVEIGPSGRRTNVGTFTSIIDSFGDYLKFYEYDKMLKEKVFSKEIVRSKYRLSWRLPPLFFSDAVNGWSFWYPGPDLRVVERSQLFRSEYLNERPVEFKTYAKLPLFYVLLMMICAPFVISLALFSFGRYLLTEYSSFFTFGQFTKDGPTRKQVEEGSCKFTLIGEGWKYKLSEPSDQHESKPDSKLKLTISGPEPAYPFTAMCMVHSALVVLQESDKMPLEGGVLTPGVAFENTTLHKRLDDRGMKFSFEKM